jgi:DNA-binding GntR family transcriptional regulator
MIMKPGGTARPLLQDRAYEKLKELIQSGSLPAGSFHTERLLSERLGMSKTPIRAALTRLDLEGFVSVSPQIGIAVRETSLHEIVDLFDIRVALESFVVRSLAGRLTPPQVERLRANLREQKESARAGDAAELTRLDTGFHLLFCDFLDNREITRVLVHLRDKLHRVILRVMSRAEGRLASAAGEHAGIAEAVIRGKGELAAERLRRHLEFGKQFLLAR